MPNPAKLYMNLLEIQLIVFILKFIETMKNSIGSKLHFIFCDTVVH